MVDHLLIPLKTDLHGVFLGIEDHVHIHFFVEGHIGDLYLMVKKGDTPVSVDYASLTHAEDVLGRGISLR